MSGRQREQWEPDCLLWKCGDQLRRYSTHEGDPARYYPGVNGGDGAGQIHGPVTLLYQPRLAYPKQIQGFGLRISTI